MKAGYSDTTQSMELEAESEKEKFFLDTLANQIGSQGVIYVVYWDKERGVLLLNNPQPRPHVL